MHRIPLATAWLFLILGMSLAACDDAAQSPASDSTADTGTSAALSVTTLAVAADTGRSSAPAQFQTGATPTPSPDSLRTPLEVRVWWPDELYPDEGSPAETVLNRQLESFVQTYASYDLDLRRKRSSGLGGILPTLRTALPVAPGVTPHLTLMKRADMVTAATEGLILPVEGWAPDDVLQNLLPGTRTMGEIDEVLYGIPYTLNFEHMLYRTSTFDEPPLSFADVLARKPAYRCPAGVPSGSEANRILLLQYLEAGGQLANINELSVLDREPMLAVLEYYEAGTTAGIFDASLLDITQYETYWNDFVTAEANFVCVNSSTYLHHKDSLQAVGLSPIPTLDGNPITVVDGWMWVLTTQDPDEQAQARAFLSWMMRISQQSEFTEALGVIPSQERALRLWSDTRYASFTEQMLAQGVFVSNAVRNSSIAVNLQAGFAAVLQGQSAEAVIAQILDTS